MAERIEHPLTGAVGAAVSAVVEAAREAGDEDGAALLRQEQRLAALGGSTVVVVGEKNRGKSSLINALLGRPGLLPVDADIATRLHVRIQYDDQDGAQVRRYGAAEAERIDLAQVADYVDQGRAVDPETGQERHPDVEAVELGVVSDLLADGLVLVDTPGVGGLVSGHSDITLAMLERADAVLFVVDGSSELHASEIAFLRRATERKRAVTVLFVLTRIDQHPQWPAVAAKSQVLLREFVPRFADSPWFEVSSKDKLESERCRVRPGTAERADRLLARSRFQPLLQELRQNILLRIEAGRLRVLVGEAVGLTQRLDAQLAERLRSLVLDPRLPEDLERRSGEVARLQEADARWRERLARGFRETESVLRVQLDTGLGRLEEAELAAVARGGKERMTETPRSLADGVRGLVLELQNTMADRADTLVSEVAEELGVHGVHVPRPEVLYGGVPEAEAVPSAAADWPDPGVSGSDLVRRVAGEEGAGVLTAAATAGGMARQVGQSLGRMPVRTRLVLGAAVAVVGVGVVVAGLFRRQARMRAELTKLVQAAIAEARSTVPPGLQQTNAELLAEAEAALTQRIQHRLDEVHAALDRARDNAERAEEELAGPRQEASEQQRRVRGFADDLRELSRRLEDATVE